VDQKCWPLPYNTALFNVIYVDYYLIVYEDRNGDDGYLNKGNYILSLVNDKKHLTTTHL